MESDSAKLLMLCDSCHGLSEDVYTCAHCGNSILERTISVAEFVQGNDEESSAVVDQAAPKTKRRREINCLGMFLKQRKQELTKRSKHIKLEMDAELKTWSNLSKEEKSKFKLLSNEDRNTIIKGTEMKCESPLEILNKKLKINAKNKKDSEVRSSKKKQMNIMEQDVTTSRSSLYRMINEKKEALTSIEKDLVTLDGEEEKLIVQADVTEKLIEVKKTKLDALKKEYRQLYSKHKNMVK